MKKYEYTSYDITFEFKALDITFFDNMLAKKGEEGWELVSVITEQREDLNTINDKSKFKHCRTFYFKREI
jgi:hypothetical protein